jgi:ABC-type amino acid transport substrate-binding protein
VRQNGILRLCANPSALPYSNIADRGGVAGFEVELAEVLAHEMGLEFGVIWVRNAGDIKNSDCDALMGAVASAASYDREGLTGPLTTHLPLRFSRPYADSGVVLDISSRSPVRRLEDLHGQNIGVKVGTVEHEWLAKHGSRVSVLRLSRRHN